MEKEHRELFSCRVPAGSRTYFFDVKESHDGHCKYLTISESRITDTGFQRDRVMVFEEYFKEFYDGFKAAMDFVGLKSQRKAPSLDEIRKTHPRAYEPWRSEEEGALRAKFQSGLKIKQLADIFERQPGAIRSRLRKLGLM
jgi:hypothetical protein